MQNIAKPLFFQRVVNTLDNVEKDNFKALEIGETYVNDSNRHILYKVEYLNVLGTYQRQWEVLKPTESITKTNILNKVKIYI